MQNRPEIALIGLGANLSLGNLTLAETIRRALSRIPLPGESVIATSRLFETPCFPVGAGPDYVNAAMALETTHAPRDLLNRLHDIEADFGRERIERWGQRTLDLDLLAYGDHVLPNDVTYQAWVDLPPDEQKIRAPDKMILPHPRLHERPFVLIPLRDVAPDWRHPVLDRTITEFCADLEGAEVDAIVPL